MVGIAVRLEHLVTGQMLSSKATYIREKKNIPAASQWRPECPAPIQTEGISVWSLNALTVSLGSS